jgi:O-antigen ligase
MARLAHNDYLEQFSDSGLPGGILYSAWIIAALLFIGQRLWKSDNPALLAIFLGLLGWFIQGLGEFELFIPALAWTAFTFMGCLLGQDMPNQAANPFDKKPPMAKIPGK